ncbi:NAD-dependent epimerase/dehydratase family protein [Capnocytophaga canimorsus]|uniref:NAD-dependent epimerase/dehydratase family protein n=1 Tax=Capnocytophaga canimorsus TaxID=28188 RepID=UPI0015621D96|nr:NAD-dependent epimerase/dehydratase family protein [Capnocytophaga canimorsus]
MKLVFTGGSGFIGQNLLKSFDNTHGVSLRSSDWENELKEADVIINLVGKAHNHKGIATEQDFRFANIELTKQIFNEFIKSKANLLIYVSSIASVEEFESFRLLDEEMPCNPFSFYGKTKREAEKWLLAQELPVGKKLIILRPPMVHGEGDKGSLKLLYNLISNGMPYPLSNFNNKRSFVSIDNFVYFIRKIIENYPKIESGIYHIADDEMITTKQIIEIIESVERKKVLNLKVPKFLIYSIAKIGDVVPIPLNTTRLKKMTGTLLVSNQKIKSALGIEKLPLSAKEGLEKTIRSFKR